MRGVHFLIDERGRKSAAVVDLRVHGELWQDIKTLLENRNAQSATPSGMPNTGDFARPTE